MRRAPDFASDERHKVNPAVMENGAGVALALEQASPRASAPAESRAEHTPIATKKPITSPGQPAISHAAVPSSVAGR